MKTFTKLRILLIANLFGCGYALMAQSVESVNSFITIDIEDVVGKQPLVLNDKQYTNQKGETFNVTTFNYFISNIRLQDKKGKEYIVPQDDSYFLIKASDSASQKINLKVPEGKYTKLTFTIGVDSLRNTMDISRRTGALDPTGGMNNGMYWSWNSGYIFAKLEGISDQAPVDKIGLHKFRYHIGGFGGYNKPGINNIKTVTIDLSKNGTAWARKNRKTKIFIQADAGIFFDGQTKISIAENPKVMFGEMGCVISKNYEAMFSHTATEN